MAVIQYTETTSNVGIGPFTTITWPAGTFMLPGPVPATPKDETGCGLPLGSSPSWRRGIWA